MKKLILLIFIFGFIGCQYIEPKEEVDLRKIEKNGKPLIKFSSLKSLLTGERRSSIDNILGKPNSEYYSYRGINKNGQVLLYYYAALDDYNNKRVHVIVWLNNDELAESVMFGKQGHSITIGSQSIILPLE